MLSSITTLNRATITHEQLAKTIDHALLRSKLIEAGVTRIGATATAAILDEFARRQQH